MPASQSRAAYEDCFDYLDQALAQPDGIRVSVGLDDDDDSPGKAKQLQVRLHYARSLDRRDSKIIYPKDDPNHGTSVYDPLIVKIRQSDGEIWVYIEPRTAKAKVEAIRPGQAIAMVKPKDPPPLQVNLSGRELRRRKI